MVALSALWLPILLSAVIVFLASFVIHTVIPWHKGEYPPVPNQDRVMDALRPFSIAPGDYMLPRSGSMAEMSTPAFIEKLKRGPVMILTVLPNGPVSMGKALVWWFVYSLVVSLFAAYLAHAAVPSGASYLKVFQVVGATTFVGYSLALWQIAIWYSRSLTTTFKSTVDGLVYALLTAGVFGWLWPQ